MSDMTAPKYESPEHYARARQAFLEQVVLAIIGVSAPGSVASPHYPGWVTLQAAAIVAEVYGG